MGFIGFLVLCTYTFGVIKVLVNAYREINTETDEIGETPSKEQQNNALVGCAEEEAHFV